jgi:hypothetical protein
MKGVIHRDLKPANVFVAAAGHVKVIDFGIAHISDKDQRQTLLTQPGQIVGTLEYMSPEQIDGDAAAIDGRSDVYALGVLAYEVLTARAPFTGPSVLVMEGHQSQPPPPLPTNLAKPVPKQLAGFIWKALTKEREGRYQNGREAREALAEIRLQLRMPPPAGEATTDPSKRTSGVVPVAAPSTAIVSPTEGVRDVSIRPMRAQLAVTEARLEARDVTSEVLRKEQRFRIAAQTLAEALIDSGIAGSEMSVQLARISEGDEEVVRRATDYALVDSHGEDLEQAMREREGMLRSAVVDLRLAERQATDVKKIADLSRQAEILERKLGEVALERVDLLRNRDQDRGTQRHLLAMAEQQLEIRYEEISQGILASRPYAKLPRLIELYALFDACKRELGGR